MWVRNWLSFSTQLDYSGPQFRANVYQGGGESELETAVNSCLRFLG